ncbi:LPXTG-motif cell wall anchor domain protein [Plakobranchus ocellatus]|uniref:LPXTG-motif cell wall anchor domain protein n=1 Tax=Plakobranchus ocellatus TaxID=259542 RepID=A0AAV4AKB2_9GAST|nr:LPXTG-motif cell wall anchor domain protein [Plakobranchus ocellatus]
MGKARSVCWGQLHQVMDGEGEKRWLGTAASGYGWIRTRSVPHNASRGVMHILRLTHSVQDLEREYNTSDFHQNTLCRPLNSEAMWLSWKPPTWVAFYLFLGILLSKLGCLVCLGNTASCYKLGWFGDECHFRCHCAANSRCDQSDGTCSEGCSRGWFGPSCQYAAAKYKVINQGDDSSLNWLTDDDDNTCNPCDLSSIHVHLETSQQLTWIKIVVNHSVSLVNIAGIKINTRDTKNKRPGVKINTRDTKKKCPGVKINTRNIKNKRPDVKINTRDTKNKRPDVKINTRDTKNKRPDVKINTKDTKNKRPDVKINTRDRMSKLCSSETCYLTRAPLRVAASLITKAILQQLNVFVFS